MLNISKEYFEELKSKKLNFSVTLKTSGDDITPINIFYNLQGKNKFLLESAFLKETKGRFSYLGVNPYMKIFSKGKEITIQYGDNAVETYEGDILEVLKNYVVLGDFIGSSIIPFEGGAVGYLGYDSIRLYEDIPDDNIDELNIHDSCFNIYKIIICYDHLKHDVYLSYNVFNEDELSYLDIENLLQENMKSVKERKIVPELTGKNENIQFTSNYDLQSYDQMVEKAKEYIKQGDIFQVVLSQRVKVEIKDEPFMIYRRLRSLNPSPYLFYVEFDGYTAFGASPESLVKVNNNIVETNPIAGSRPRGKNREEDEYLKKDLLADEKERAEHLMLVDLGRNDIGKVSRFGSVCVKRFMEVDFYSHIMHIVSTVTGELEDNKDCFDSLRACFPAGTVSGAPKIRAMEIIDELENVRRGIYAGALGFFGFNGNMDTCIAIRTVVVKEQQAYLQAGGGIVYDSIGENEYKESINKMGALREVM